MAAGPFGSPISRRIKEADSGEQVMEAFLTAVCTNPEDMSHVVLKSADQIAVFEVLQGWQPQN